MIPAGECGVADPVSELLRSLRVEGAVLLHHAYAPPWAIRVPDRERLAKALGTGARSSVIPFHWVLDGELRVSPDDAAPIVLRSGEALVVNGGEAHHLGQGFAPAVVELEDILRGDARHPSAPGTPSCVVICGVLIVTDAAINPLLASLPAWARTTPSSPLREALVAEAGGARGGQSYCISRYLELMFAAAVRDAYERDIAPVPSALRGLRDPAVGRALGQVHRAPGGRWTVEGLAGLVGLSPSRFAARFRAAVGRSPMNYVLGLRIGIAARLLERTEDSVSSIADAVGYDNVPAFGRAFKRTLGSSPGRWRQSSRLTGPRSRSLGAGV